MKRTWLLIVVGLAGCGSKTMTTHVRSAPYSVRLAQSLRLSSPAFKMRSPIPRQFTCDGQDVPIPLSISGVPKETHELLLVMRDPDAPTGNFVHWAVAGIAPTAATIPTNGVQGRNSFGKVGYRGPCPPPGDKPHHYVITLSALSGPSGLSAGFSPDQAVKSGQLAIATLIGTYARH